jgi:hypothetical protein
VRTADYVQHRLPLFFFDGTKGALEQVKHVIEYF